jgi:tetratricopeptide (TPR) repeat protein
MDFLSYRRIFLSVIRSQVSLLTTLSLSFGIAYGQTSGPQGANPQTTNSTMSVSQARTLQDLESVRAAEQQHLPDAQQGALWLQLAFAYWDATQFPKAEDAFDKSLRLLKGVPSERKQYAEILDDLASLYLSYGRQEDAESTATAALKVRQELGNPLGIAMSQIRLADIALTRHEFKKAERLAQPAMQVMQSSPDATNVALLSGFITLTYARCSLGNSGEGLQSAQQAIAFANGHYASQSAPVGFALETLGFAQWKAGATQEGEKDMREGIEILQKTLAPADPRLAGVMMQYSTYLVKTDRPVEARAIQQQVSRMTGQAGIYCSNCAVSVNTLSNSLR